MATLVLHGVVTWFMVGLIWLVQIVHYPLMADVGRRGYPAYQRAHMRRISWVVAPVMLCELALAAWLAWAPPSAVPAGEAWCGLALLAGVWLTTAAASVPAHGALLDAFDAGAHRRLVASNWLRTVGWTLRGGLAALWLWAAVAPQPAT